MRYPAYPKYKISGMDWIETVPSHWNVKKAKYIFKKIDRPIRGNDGVVTAFRDGEVTLRSRRRSSGFTFSIKEIGYQGIRKGDLVIHEMDGFAGAIGVSDSDGKCSPIYSICLPKISANNFYYAYLLRLMAQSGFITALAKGIRERSTDFRFHIFKELNLPIPPLEEQTKIVSFLDSEISKIDQIIEKYEGLIKLLKEKRIALISHVLTKGLDKDVKMKNSNVEWIGEIPDHWKIKKIKYLLIEKAGSIKTGPFGSQLKSEDMKNGHIKVYNQETVLSKNISIGENYIKIAKFNELKPFEVYSGDILVTTRGSIGKCLIIPSNSEKGVLHPCLLRIQVNQEKISRQYLAIMIENSYLVQTHLKLMSNATTIDVIYQDNMKNVKIPLPPLEEQKIILKYLDNEIKHIDDSKDKITEQIILLKEFKVSLISHTITGKIDVMEESL